MIKKVTKIINIVMKEKLWILKKQIKPNRFKPKNDLSSNYWFTLNRDDIFKFTGKKFSPYIIYLSGNMNCQSQNQLLQIFQIIIKSMQ